MLSSDLDKESVKIIVLWTGISKTSELIQVALKNDLDLRRKVPH